MEEYLASFRGSADPLRMPQRLSTRGPANATSSKSRLREALPASAYDLAVGGYRGLRRLAHRDIGRGHTLPDFLVLGVAKCGTTSLFDWLCEHPSIVRPTTDGRPRKELLFFDYQIRNGLDWYRTHFPLERERRDFELHNGHPFLTGEATATYLTDYWAPERVAKLLPSARFIVSLRNPVDRAFSAFHMSRREELEESERFETALALEAERLAEENARVRADRRYMPAPPAPLGYWSYLQRSRYADHVARWLEFVPRDRFLFLRFEDLADDPQGALDAVHEFLGLPEHRRSGEFQKLNTAEYEPMNPETRTQLIEYFRPYNERLRELTGIDFGWDR